VSTFSGVDYFDADSLLSDEERSVRDTLRKWVDELLLPVIGECYVERRFPKQLIPQLGELGVFGANLPQRYGCAGLNNVAYGLLMQELERGDSGIRSFASAYCPLTRPNRFSERIVQLGPQGIAVECSTAELRSADGRRPSA
jgi:glutaryl-CoA dehydrogenase